MKRLTIIVLSLLAAFSNVVAQDEKLSEFNQV